MPKTLVLTGLAGGMIRAIEMITDAKKSNPSGWSSPVVVDLHPARPEYRGFMAGPNPISMQADPTFAEIEEAGGKVEKNADAHTVLDDMFLVSGMIPRVTPYEKGVMNGIRFESEKRGWEKDEEIADERFLMCNLKGIFNSVLCRQRLMLTWKLKAREL
jgi:7,8-dihydropterin-6-yl-methyl-4-(beta-D-ribofuranosyl)aminobenzene 5'-phosphate synthase